MVLGLVILMTLSQITPCTGLIKEIVLEVPPSTSKPVVIAS
jgi:hypothetical protein